MPTADRVVYHVQVRARMLNEVLKAKYSAHHRALQRTFPESEQCHMQRIIRQLDVRPWIAAL